jgi:hypothetical protein
MIAQPWKYGQAIIEFDHLTGIIAGGPDYTRVLASSLANREAPVHEPEEHNYSLSLHIALRAAEYGSDTTASLLLERANLLTSGESVSLLEFLLQEQHSSLF